MQVSTVAQLGIWKAGDIPDSEAKSVSLDILLSTKGATIGAVNMSIILKGVRI